MTPEQQFTRALGQASYHYADDTAGEWGLAREHVAIAGRIAAQNHWPMWKLREQFRKAEPLVAAAEVESAFVDALYAEIDRAMLEVEA